MTIFGQFDSNLTPYVLLYLTFGSPYHYGLTNDNESIWSNYA